MAILLDLAALTILTLDHAVIGVAGFNLTR
jgi:hypothetical protein